MFKTEPNFKKNLDEDRIERKLRRQQKRRVVNIDDRISDRDLTRIYRENLDRIRTKEVN